MTLATPAWLLGLLFVPVIWYLHRSGPVLRRHPVASLELWQDDRARAVQAGRRRPADPAWLRRAAIFSLLCLALAGPQWQGPIERVTLWIDDSLSMQTLEQGASRLDRGFRLAQAALRESAVRDVIVRPLSEPMHAYASAGATTMQAIASHAGVHEPQFPAPDAFDPDRAHWLVTDGADADVNAWLGNSPVDRVIQVAATARNVGIARVTVRPQPGDARTGALQIRLRNGGSAAETRTVEIAAGAGTLAARAVSINAGESVTLDQVVSLPLQRLIVRLTPSDALPQDDRAIVEGGPLSSIAVRIDPACPIEVTRAVGAHPALRLTHAIQPGLIVDCGSGWEHDRAAPRLVLHQGPPAELDVSAVTWSQATAGTLPAVAGFPPRTRGTLDAPRPVDDVLVAAGDAPLVIRRAGGPRIVESIFDLGAAESQGTDTVPLLFAFLADVALDRPLLDRSAALVRDDDASMIARRADLGRESRSSRRTQSGGTPFGLTFVGLAVFLLAWDLLALARRWLRDYGPRARIVA